MANLSNRVAAAVAGSLLALGLLAATAAPAIAEDTCATVGTNPLLNYIYGQSDVHPNPTALHDVVLANGDTLVFTWVTIRYAFFEVGGTAIVGGFSEFGNDVTSGTRSYVANSNQTVAVRASGNGSDDPSGGSQTVTCIPGGGGGGGDDDDDDDDDPPPPPPPTDGDAAAASRDAMAQSMAGARPDTSPLGLPGSLPPPPKDPCGELRAKLAESRARLVQVEVEVAAREREIAYITARRDRKEITEDGFKVAEEEINRDLRKLYDEQDDLEGTEYRPSKIKRDEKLLADCEKNAAVAGQPVAATPAPLPAAATTAPQPALTPAEKRALEDELAKLEEQRAEVESEVFNETFRNFIGGVGSPVFAEAELEKAKALDEKIGAIKRKLGILEPFVEDDEVEHGDGEPVFFAPQVQAPSVPWPVNVSAYAHDGSGRFDAAGDRMVYFNGTPVKLWARARGTLVDGSFGRSAFAGSLQFGGVMQTAPGVDVGLLGHVFAGEARSEALDGELTTLAGSLGAYTKFHLPGGGSAGLSATHEWGANDITLGGATGSFASSRWTMDGSVSMAPVRFDGLVLTPSAALAWKHVLNGGYVDSNSLAVPATTDSTLALSGILDLAYPMLGDGTFAVTMTPRLTIRGNWYIDRAETIDLGTLGMLEASAVTLDVNGGIAFGLVGGGTLDLAIGASGLAGQERSYTGRIGYRMPLN